MQAFYPSPLKQRLSLGGLLLCVLLAHLVGLLSLAQAWPSQMLGNSATRIRFQTAALSEATALTNTKDLSTPTDRPPAIAPSKTPVSAPTPAPANAPSMRLASEDLAVASQTPDTPTEENASAPTTPPPASPSAQAAASETPPEPLPAPLPAPLPTPMPAPATTQAEQALPAPAPAVATAPAVPSPAALPATPAAPAVTEQNNYLDKAAASPSLAPSASNNEASSWLNSAHFNWPASTRFIYEVIGESKGLRFNADGDMLWKQDGQQYEMRLEIKHFLLGSKTQTSVGQLGPQGLLPKRFGDKYKQEVAAHFDRDKGQLIFSASSNPQPLLPGAQDRLSLFAQLGAMLAGSPELRQNGQQISFQVVAAKSADIWTFQVEKQEALQLPAGKFNAWKLSRVFKGTYDQTADVWLSPAHGYLPIKVRIAQTNGDVLEQNLSKVQAP